jgi:glycosidase
VKTRHLLFVLIAYLFACAAATAQSIDHLEPPFWWVGMKVRSLQLMVHGDHIGDLTPRLTHRGVTLRPSTQVENPNYLFLQMDIAPNTPAGSFAIGFYRGRNKVLTQTFELRARTPGSAQRQGFGPADAVYLIVPDRFANGNTLNDSVPGYSDTANRTDPNGRHGGDLQGMADRLDYIAGMGFTQIWPTPLVENNEPKYSYHGYAATNHYRIDPRFGSNEDYRRFVAQSRAKGLGVIQDIVLNHIGVHHWWMADLPSRDWINNPGKYAQTTHAHITALDPHGSDSDLRAFADGWFDTSMPDLNQRQPLMAQYLIQNTVWWIEYAGLSGIREDTYSYADKAFLARWSQRVMLEYPHLNIVGEEMSYQPAMVAYWQRGQHNHDGYVSHMPSMMDFPLFGALKSALTTPEGREQGLYELYHALGMDFVYADPGQLMMLDGNHDTNRLFAGLNQDMGLTRMALAFVATTQRIPQFFYGTELAMTGPKERDDGLVRADFPGGWAGDTQDAVSGAGLSEAQRELQAWLRKLLNWRKSSVAVHQGKLMQYGPKEGVYAYFRYDKGNAVKVMVVMNKNPTDVTLDTTRFSEMLGAQARGTDVITGQVLALGQTLQLPARSVKVLEVRD